MVWGALLLAQSLGGGLPEIIAKLTDALRNPWVVRWTDKSLLTILVCTGAYVMALALHSAEQGRRRDGAEHGSAAWATPQQVNAQFCQKQNKLLTRNVRLGLDTHKHRRSLNVLVIGGSGAAKTRSYVKPNILEANTNYVITDPKSEVLLATGGYLKSQGYDIRVLNLVNLAESDGYNPFRYIRDEKDALKLVNNLIQATTPKGSHESDPFWTKAETALLQAIILMLWQEAPEYEQNFSMVMRVLEYAEVKEEDEEYVSPLDLLFQAMEREKPDSVAVRQYKVFKLAAGKTAKSILISCGARLAVFDIAELREVTAYDELELDTLGDRKTALFLIMSDTDDSFNFLISMCYTQLFNLLCEKADDVYDGRLPVHVRCLIDECANIGQIPKLEKLVATIRSREISACLVLQAQSQLKAIYKDNADTIIGNMDTSIFLGGKEPTTLKELAAVLGKETIDTYNTGESRGRETSHSLNYQKLGKELMSQDELAVMDGGKCILQLRGVRPFLSDKYDITKHPNFKYTADADDKNAFDIEAFLSARLKLKPNEVCDVYEVDTKGA